MVVADTNGRRLRALALASLGLVACCSRSSAPEGHATADSRTAPLETSVDDDRAAERLRMVERHLAARDVVDPLVLEAMRTVPRHRFVPVEAAPNAYVDSALSIGLGQTISQPYVVARMTELAAVGPEDRVLEIGTGSGYQAAVLAEIVERVYSIEIVEPLGRRAAETLAGLGYTNIELRIGDGYRGWPEEAPFDAIVVTAAPPAVPAPLLDQLAIGGRLVVPVGVSYQELRLITRTATGFEERAVFPVRFVPMTGEAQRERR